MTAPTKGRWDQQRAKKVGRHGTGLPHCAGCGRVRALSPCRECASPAELAALPADPRTAEQRDRDVAEWRRVRR